MAVSIHSMVESMAPMLESLCAILDKAEAHAKETGQDLVNARLAPDMFTLAEQVREASFYARDAVARLSAQRGGEREETAGGFEGLKEQLTRAADRVAGAPAHIFEGDEDADCSLPLDEDRVIRMDGERYLKAWALPHFYFHLVTAYAILRNAGVPIGKMDYLSQVGGFIEPKG